MNIPKVIKELKEKYPDKQIIFDDPDNPTEIIVELESTSEHPEKSLALAVVGKSKPHFHKTTTEIYEVVKGQLILNINGQEHVLEEGEKRTIPPNTIHSAQGEETWFLTYSTPGWRFDDHIIVDKV